MLKYDGPSEFVHLHCHTVYSPLDGCLLVEELFKACEARQWPAVAVTEHGMLSSVPDCYFASKSCGVRYVPGCFLANQPIYTANGVVPISEINDHAVLTHRNRFKRVKNLQIREYAGDIVVISAWGMEGIRCTPEHPFLVRRVQRKQIKRGVWVEEIDVGFVKAADLCRNKYHRTYSTKRSLDRSSKRRYEYYLCAPRPNGPGIYSIDLTSLILKPGDIPHINGDTIESVTYERDGYKTTKDVKLPVHLRLDEEFLWICGLWLAEGSLKQDSSIEYTLGTNEIEFANRIQTYFNSLNIHTGIRIRTDKNTIDVSVFSAYLMRLFEALFGKGFAGKSIKNEWLFGLSREQISCLLEGLLDGDAKRTKSASYLKICNQTLAWQARIMLAAIGQYSAIAQIKNHDSDNLGYAIRKREDGHCYYDWDDEYIYLPVCGIDTEKYDGLVYNMEVEDDNTYNVGVAVHNCEIYFNDYEPLRQEMVARGEKVSILKTENPDLYQRVVRNRHLTAIAKNMVGFHNLVRMTTEAYQFGFYGRPRIWFDKLLEYAEGLIILSGCLNGPVAFELGQGNLRTEDKKGGLDYIDKFKEAFGEDFYIEVQMPYIREEGKDDRKAFWLLHRTAKALKIPAVLTNDVHYLARRDFETQKLMMAISQGLAVDSPDLFHVNSDEQYLKTRADLWEIFKTRGYDAYVSDSQFEQSCDNTLVVVDKCDSFEPDLESKIPASEGSEDLLKRLVLMELVRRGLHKCQKRYLIDNEMVTYKEQVAIELRRIFEKNFADYFLITRDLVHYSLANGWPVGPRGSVSGSLVCYLLGISEINPMTWGLSFDRFLSAARGGKMLDIRAK